MPPAPSSRAAQLMGQNGFVSFPQGGNVLFQRRLGAPSAVSHDFVYKLNTGAES